MAEKILKIYSDAYSCNAGTERKLSGYTFIVVNSKNKIIHTGQESFRSTNNFAELMGIAMGLEYIDSNKEKFNRIYTEIDLYSDSEYVIKGINERLSRWKQCNWTTSEGKEIKNKELWMYIDIMINNLKEEINPILIFKWIRGHTTGGKSVSIEENPNTYFQELCDSECTKLKNKTVKYMKEKGWIQ